MSDNGFFHNIGLIKRDLLTEGRELQNELARLDHRITEHERELKQSEQRIRGLLKAEVGELDATGMVRGMDTEAPTLRRDEETRFARLQSDLDEFRQRRQFLVNTIRRDFAEVRLAPGTFDLREPSRQL